MNGDSDLLSSFRQKANFMRSWKPGSAPSVRHTGLIRIIYGVLGCALLEILNLRYVPLIPLIPLSIFLLEPR